MTILMMLHRRVVCWTDQVQCWVEHLHILDQDWVKCLQLNNDDLQLIFTGFKSDIEFTSITSQLDRAFKTW